MPCPDSPEAVALYLFMFLWSLRDRGGSNQSDLALAKALFAETRQLVMGTEGERERYH